MKFTIPLLISLAALSQASTHAPKKQSDPLKTPTHVKGPGSLPGVSDPIVRKSDAMEQIYRMRPWLRPRPFDPKYIIARRSQLPTARGQSRGASSYVMTPQEIIRERTQVGAIDTPLELLPNFRKYRPGDDPASRPPVKQLNPEVRHHAPQPKLKKTLPVRPVLARRNIVRNYRKQRPTTTPTQNKIPSPTNAPLKRPLCGPHLDAFGRPMRGAFLC